MAPQDLDECMCGDYRRDHIGGAGACKFNLPHNIGHGGPSNCREFRMAAPANGFHWRDGIYFARNDDGSVYVSIPDKLDAPCRELTIPGNEWCSIVAAVCGGGGNADTVAKAAALHDGAQ
jgi:hypothetical protein